ncbi:MAG: enolase C-terminal domain-like protein, partial [Bdellovibrio sp.]
MELSFYPYSLKPVHKLNTTARQGLREGVLLKVKNKTGAIGYADLHPWAEFGDRPWVEQLQDCQSGRISEQLACSLEAAAWDAQLRLQKRHIFEEGLPVENNFLISDLSAVSEEKLKQAWQSGYRVVKLKAGHSAIEEIRMVQILAEMGFQIRLDFNAAGTWSDFQAFMEALPAGVCGAIEYVEDPFPYEWESWNEARRWVRLALDNEVTKVKWDEVLVAAWDVLILKPAKMSVEKAVQRSEKLGTLVAVTSYMDHPLGVMHALGVAMKL